MMTQKLAITNEEKKLVIAEAKLLIRTKPSLLKYSEHPKIGDYSSSKQEFYNEELIKYLLTILGIMTENDDPRNKHYLAVDKFLLDSLKDFTYAEVKQAFLMMLEGKFDSYPEFKDKRIFNKLDCVILSSVMKCYKKEKKIQLEPYERELREKIKKIEKEKNKPSVVEIDEIMKSSILRLFNQYKKDKKITDCVIGVFNYYSNTKPVFNLKKQDYLDLYEKGKNRVKTERAKEGLNKFKDTINRIQSKKTKNNSEYDPEVVVWVKRQVLINFFENTIETKTNLENLL